MENFNLNLLSNKIKNNKKKIYQKINDIVSLDLSPEKLEKMKSNEEEKFIQLFDDSDSLEEISAELGKKIENEEEKKLLLTNDIKIIGEEGQIKKKRSIKFRNSSLINIGMTNYKKSFFIGQGKSQKKEDLNDKNTFTNKKNILLFDSKIIEEEEQNEEDDNNSADDNPISKIGKTKINLNQMIFKENNELLESPKMDYLILRPSKSTEIPKIKSKLLDKIKNLSKSIHVFIFDSDEFININVYPSNTVKEIKTRIIRELKSKNYNLTTFSTDAYDLRVIDEIGESPDMDFPPLRDYVQVAGLKPQALAFLKNKNYASKASREKSFDQTWVYQKQQNLIFGSFKTRNSRFSVVPEEDDDEEGPEKYEVKIFYKDINKENTFNSETLFLNPEDSLKNILEIFFKKELLKIKNINLYYFITHNSEDLENPFNLDINIKYLQPPYELDLCYKYFPDQPKALNTYQISVNRKSVEERLKQISTKLTSMKKDKEEKMKNIKRTFSKNFKYKE